VFGNLVWCVDCENKEKPVIRRAAHLVPVREGYYDLCANQLGIDMRLMGVCSECLLNKNKFQQDNVEEVDPHHKNLVYKN